jgi:thioredoxin 1
MIALRESPVADGPKPARHTAPMRIEPSSSNAPRLLVACLCADWCYICGEYRAVFESLRDEFGERAQFVWIDIEDDEATLGAIEVDDFPTWLIAHGDEVLHFGPVMPRREAALAKLRDALLGDAAVIDDAQLAALAQRMRALADIRAH